MRDEDIKYVNLIIEEIVSYVDNFKRMKFPTEKAKLLYIANVISKMNVFLSLLEISKINDEILIQATQIISYNLIRFVEICDYTEDELQDAMNNYSKK
jgi:hypothetical protein